MVMQATVITRAGGANWPAILQDKDIILKPPHFWGGFFFYIFAWKRTSNIWD
jgi:hypothetical protein